jgi:hypothetical protein
MTFRRFHFQLLYNHKQYLPITTITGDIRAITQLSYLQMRHVMSATNALIWSETMKRLALFATVATIAFATPALAGNGGKQFVNANVNITTGKGGILGTVLGTVKGKNGLNVNANIVTGKGGILGTLLGGKGHSHHGGW